MKRMILLLALFAPPCFGAGLDTLLAEDRLRIRSWLQPAEGIVQGQEVRLLIEVSTPRWFAGGTGIKAPEVRRLLILRRNEFAVNLSRREGGATWVVQRWQLELYPQREGAFTVPPVALTLAVNDAELGIVRGTVETVPLTFEASVPAVLANTPRWLATPSFEVRQSFDRSLTGLAPGDAFERSIELEATRLTALMLPEPQLTELDGLAAYPDLPELEDRSNRGEATALRRQTATYVVEKAGQYRLPAQLIRWWNTDTNSLETATLPAVTIDAGIAVIEEPAPTLPAFWWQALALLLAVVLLVALLARLQRPSEKPLRTARRALQRGDAGAAAQALYRWLNLQHGRRGWLSLREVAAEAQLEDDAGQLLAAAYGDEPRPAKRSGLVRALRKRRQRAATAQGNPLNPG
ncbi:MAG: hypothetical protein V2I66_11455 [Halieaceae bacterium]|jgi:hypothetical protein|nr:hypothetical protein [Halieaceae bacterium]